MLRDKRVRFQYENICLYSFEEGELSAMTHEPSEYVLEVDGDIVDGFADQDEIREQLCQIPGIQFVRMNRRTLQFTLLCRPENISASLEQIFIKTRTQLHLTGNTLFFREEDRVPDLEDTRRQLLELADTQPTVYVDIDGQQYEVQLRALPIGPVLEFFLCESAPPGDFEELAGHPTEYDRSLDDRPFVKSLVLSDDCVVSEEVHAVATNMLYEDGAGFMTIPNTEVYSIAAERFLRHLHQ